MENVVLGVSHGATLWTMSFTLSPEFLIVTGNGCKICWKINSLDCFISLLQCQFLKNYFSWLHWVFVTFRGLSLVVASRGYSSLRCAGVSLWWLLTVEHRLQAHGLQQLQLAGSRAQSGCGVPAWLLACMWNLPRPGIEPMSPELAGWFLSTAPADKSSMSFLFTKNKQLINKDQVLLKQFLPIGRATGGDIMMEVYGYPWLSEVLRLESCLPHCRWPGLTFPGPIRISY